MAEEKEDRWQEDLASTLSVVAVQNFWQRPGRMSPSSLYRPDLGYGARQDDRMDKMAFNHSARIIMKLSR
jgi:hypothetical protein